MSLRRGSFRRPGRLTPAEATNLRARAVRLAVGGIMGWHSTQRRQELLLVLQGPITLQIQLPSARTRTYQIAEGHYALVPPQTLHRVLNPGCCAAHYVYVTAPTSTGR